MGFKIRTAVIGYFIRLHNFCVYARLELQAELRMLSGMIEVNLDVTLLAPVVDEHGAPIENMYRECSCNSCAQSGRAKVKSDTRRRCDLEKIVREMGLHRPYRRRKELFIIIWILRVNFTLYNDISIIFVYHNVFKRNIC